jgi:non-specific serine/threonine protein kinase/serine/threonine-protein kinase
VTTPLREAVKALFSAALELPRDDRAAFVTLQAGDNSELLAEVQSLLDAYEQAGGPLDTITPEFRSQAFAASSATRSRIGERIGAYRIVGVLGTGGMGDVFRAVRADDQYEAEVAIKLMRADVRSSLTERRFRTERQILAALDHRNIARLLDGGTTQGGAPYVVMELVIGEPIDSYCEARKLAVRERVQLFLQICAAVSYAHQHLVVHRDLKPNNILVTADGSAKLLDFGIAKLLEADARTDIPLAEADATITTLRAMTLDYASPEQVSGATVTTVSDVYSLGIVLYRLLTGTSPYRERTNDAARVAEILSDAVPRRPSDVERKLDGDLDNILLMALRKEPARRYASVEQFANDLRNYLAGMPVKARGNSLSYRAGKFFRRRKIEIAAVALVGCALIGALVFSMREARIVEHERQVAQQHFDSVRTLANTMLFDLHDEMARDAGSLKSRELLVKTSLGYLDALYKQGGADPKLQEELATAYLKVASIQGSDTEANRGDFAGALQSYARAIALLTPLLAAEPGNQRTGWALARAYVEQASLLMVARGPKHARRAADQGVMLTKTFAPAIAREDERMSRLSTAYTVQARVLGFMGLSTEAIQSYDKVIAVSEDYWHAHPDDERAFVALTNAYNNSALIDDPRLSESANYERILGLLRKSRWAIDKLLTFKPDSPDYQVRLSGAHLNTGNVLYARGQYEEARRLYQLGLPFIVRAARDTDDLNAQYTRGLFETKLAQALIKTGRIEEARALLLTSGKILSTVLERDGSLRTEYAVGLNAVRLGELFAQLASTSRNGRKAELSLWREAQVSLRRGVASLQKVSDNAALQALDKAPLGDGAAALARADSALARLQAQ